MSICRSKIEKPLCIVLPYSLSQDGAATAKLTVIVSCTFRLDVYHQVFSVIIVALNIAHISYRFIRPTYQYFHFSLDSVDLSSEQDQLMIVEEILTRYQYF